MLTRRTALALALGLSLAGAAPAPALAQEKLPVIATFSILSDLVKNVGGDRVDVTTLVGADADSHVYAPSPADAKRVAAARLVFVNGLGLEGWIARLVKASGTRAPTVTLTAGIKPRKMEDAGHGHGHGHAANDPHAWLSVANARLYVRNIRDALIAADAAGKAVYEANAAGYLARLDALETEVRESIGRIPADRRRIITSHESFGYFGDAYGITFIAPAGVSTEASVSARDVARIIAQIRKQKIPAVFMDNVADPRLMEQIARESGAKIGGRLFSDALSGPGGAAPTYIDMMRHNIRQLAEALTS